jgi:phenylpropionate dioxygenase-like ring-hydroxylating dioxygenase large terminal subunit
MTETVETATLNQWFPIHTLSDLPTAGYRDRLLGRDILVSCDGVFEVGTGRPLKLLKQYRYLWASLGAPEPGLFALPEALEDDRRVVECGAVLVNASGLRIVENFLDMAHFPFVHTNILGAEPQTEVRPYKTEIRRDVDEVWATDCFFYQPQAAKSATQGITTEYQYRVTSPFSVLLYKTCPLSPNRWDVICLFVQPLDPGVCRAHPIMFLIDEESPTAELVHFQQLIFLQDRIILENQRPILLPLDPGKEIPTRADASSVAYRRWLKEKSVRYGASTAAG